MRPRRSGARVARRRALGELLLERYGIVTREQVLAEGIPGGFSAIYAELSQLETLGVARRGYFLEGLGGAQFALPGRGRAAARPECGRRVGRRVRRRPAAGARGRRPGPALRGGAALAQAARRRRSAHPARSARRPARVAGAYVVLVGGDPIVYLERGGRALQTLVAAGDARLEAALSALVDHVRTGAIKRLGLEKVDGEPAMTSPLGPALLALGFQEGPRRLTLSA